ncbi:hypothetical protein [Corynebacterium diphtheriae]|uniref:hypothetical protein n=1 Tax=Corynebacterium diphtheriae TaxID=1717 RepID=UPI0012FFC4B0|nr:hypothetical protein [Corynebacterium diphtheriae bv. mitis]
MALADTAGHSSADRAPNSTSTRTTPADARHSEGSVHDRPNTGKNLPKTGTNTGALDLASAVLIPAGLGFVLVRRRRVVNRLPRLWG